LDAQFVDPTVAAVANVSPASITNGAGTSAATGTTQAAAAIDFQSLVTNFIASNPNVEDMVILSSPANAIALSRALNQPSLGLKGGSAFGIPWLTSGSVGALLIALDAPQILIADEGDVEVTASNSATVQMDSSPTDPTVSTTVLVSLFQANLVGLKIVRGINWARAATTAVRYISAAAYT
jgi:hypothetical protein